MGDIFREMDRLVDEFFEDAEEIIERMKERERK